MSRVVRAKSARYQKAARWPNDVWDPKLVGLPYYPKSPETFEGALANRRANVEKAREAGRLTRIGVPDGRAGQKEALVQGRRNSLLEAERLAPELFPNLDCEAERGALALEMLTELLSEAICPHYGTRHRLEAARIFPYVLAAPTIRKRGEGDALSFLLRLVAEATGRVSDGDNIPTE